MGLSYLHAPFVVNRTADPLAAGLQCVKAWTAAMLVQSKKRHHHSSLSEREMDGIVQETAVILALTYSTRDLTILSTWEALRMQV